MRLLANENVPLPSIRQLRAAGHEAVAVTEDSPGMSGRHVLARAALERWIILTFDRDNGALIHQHGLPPPAGVVYFRSIPQYPEEPAEWLLALLAAPGSILEGRFTVLESTQARQRALPG